MQKKVWRERAKDGGVIPVAGFPQVDDGDKATCTDNSSLEQAQASHTSHMHSFTGGRLGVIPSKRALSEGFEFDAV